MSELNATKWIEEYSDMLYRYVVQRVRDSETAKDLVQETFLAAWRNHKNFKGEISEKNWLFIILKNKIIDHYRKAYTRLTDSLTGIADGEAFFDEKGHWIKSYKPQAWNTDSSNTIETKEFYAILDQCLEKLKPAQNIAFTMKYLEGAASEEICKELNITPSNYWILIHRAKLQLRNCLEKNWFKN